MRQRAVQNGITSANYLMRIKLRQTAWASRGRRPRRTCAAQACSIQPPYLRALRSIETGQPCRSASTTIRRRRRVGSQTPVPPAAQPTSTVIAGNDLDLRVLGDNNGKPILAIAVVLNLAAATYWLAGALHVMGMTTTGATIDLRNGAGLFHALAMTPPIFALLALAVVPSNRPLWMLALLLNGALALRDYRVCRCNPRTPPACSSGFSSQRLQPARQSHSQVDAHPSGEPAPSTTGYQRTIE